MIIVTPLTVKVEFKHTGLVPGGSLGLTCIRAFTAFCQTHSSLAYVFYTTKPNACFLFCMIPQCASIGTLETRKN